LSLDDIGQLLWSAQGITSSRGWRTAPSAGALYPLEIDVLCGNVAEVPAGVYRYRPAAHALELRRHGDLRWQLRKASLQQHPVTEAAAVIVIVAVPGRSEKKYHDRAQRYIHMETGHVAQNVYLQAEVLGLGTVVIGAFEDDRVGDVLGLAADEAPLALLPVGHPA
jgi:SagB-type dehydrogenase family enzyme